MKIGLLLQTTLNKKTIETTWLRMLAINSTTSHKRASLKKLIMGQPINNANMWTQSISKSFNAQITQQLSTCTCNVYSSIIRCTNQISKNMGIMFRGTSVK